MSCMGNAGERFILPLFVQTDAICRQGKCLGVWDTSIALLPVDALIAFSIQQCAVTAENIRRRWLQSGRLGS